MAAPVFSASVVAVGNTATALNAVDADLLDLIVKNPGPTTIYLGGSGVTSGTGFPLASGESFSPPMGAAAILYAITASGTQNVNVLLGGVG